MTGGTFVGSHELAAGVTLALGEKIRNPGWRSRHLIPDRVVPSGWRS